MQPRIPDFFIVGQAKSGTTALYEMLRGHPQIFMPAVKEPHFFASEVSHSSRGAASTGTAQALADYSALFDAAQSGQRVGEASVFYLWSRAAARHIAELRPEARIIAILREPASFLRSLHLQLVQGHVEPESNLRRAIALEEQRRAEQRESDTRDWSQLLLYSEHMRYVEQLRRFHASFPSEHVLVLIYDDFRSDNQATVSRVLRFLEVDDMPTLQPLEVNPTVRVRSRRMHDLVHDLTLGRGPVLRVAKAGVKALLPKKMRLRALDAMRERLIYGKPRPPEDDLMMELRLRFKPEVVALSEYLDRDLVTLWGYDGVG